MKFKFKALAAALALAAAVPAHATMDLAGTGNSSMVLTLLDTTANVSASFDLGMNYMDFNSVAAAGAVSTVNNAGTSFAWNLASNADYSSAWTAFMAASTAANRTYAITAADNLGAGAGSRGYISTYVSAGAATTTSAVITAVGNFDTYLNTQMVPGNTIGNHLSVLNGSAEQAPATFFYGSSKNNGTGPVVAGAFDSTLGVVQTVVSASSFTNATNTVFSNASGFSTFTLLSNGSLSYAAAGAVAAVPEADTSAMMLAGLGLMGFIARRRNRKQA